MTSRSTRWNPERTPFLLEPVTKDYLWGGTRLSEEYKKGTEGSLIAESWECSTHANGRSVVASGIFRGKTLKEVLDANPSMLGSHAKEICPEGELPILVKLIDAAENASVQVHPDDAYAIKNEDSLGKTEMWYVLDAKPDAKLIYGFYRSMTESLVRESLREGTLEKYLRKVNVKKDDVFFVEPGCVHSIGAGILLAEIQENSDVTYRLYDYDRVDKNGEKRSLHQEKGLEVMKFTGSNTPRQPMRIFKYEPGCATDFLCRCKYFQVERKLISTEGMKGISCRSDETSFLVLLCTDGEGRIQNESAETSIPLKKGDCVFVPAESDEFILSGKMQLLWIKC